MAEPARKEQPQAPETAPEASAGKTPEVLMQKKRESDAAVDTAVADFTHSTQSWWQRAKTFFARANDLVRGGEAVSDLEGKADALKKEYEEKSEAIVAPKTHEPEIKKAETVTEAPKAPAEASLKPDDALDEAFDEGKADLDKEIAAAGGMEKWKLQQLNTQIPIARQRLAQETAAFKAAAKPARSFFASKEKQEKKSEAFARMLKTGLDVHDASKSLEELRAKMAKDRAERIAAMGERVDAAMAEEEEREKIDDEIHEAIVAEQEKNAMKATEDLDVATKANQERIAAKDKEWAEARAKFDRIKGMTERVDAYMQAQDDLAADAGEAERQASAEGESAGALVKSGGREAPSTPEAQKSLKSGEQEVSRETVPPEAVEIIDADMDESDDGEPETEGREQGEPDAIEMVDVGGGRYAPDFQARPKEGMPLDELRQHLAWRKERLEAEQKRYDARKPGDRARNDDPARPPRFNAVQLRKEREMIARMEEDLARREREEHEDMAVQEVPEPEPKPAKPPVPEAEKAKKAKEDERLVKIEEKVLKAAAALAGKSKGKSESALRAAIDEFNRMDESAFLAAMQERKYLNPSDVKALRGDIALQRHLRDSFVETMRNPSAS